MLLELRLPKEDLNSDGAIIREWRIESGSLVNKGDVICEIETTKAIVDMQAPESGFIRLLKEKDDECGFDEIIAVVADTTEEIGTYRQTRKTGGSTGIAATKKALVLIDRHGIDVNDMGSVTHGIITERDVESFIAGKGGPGGQPEACGVPAGLRKIGLFGGGLGLSQVLDILRHYPDMLPAAVYDDAESKWNSQVYGLPVRGGKQQCITDYKAGAITDVIITISTSIAARKIIYAALAGENCRFINAIDKSCNIKSNSVVGEGNVICDGVHIGNSTVIGNNNFISAKCSFDHHNIIGSHITTGPAVVTSGLVTIEDEVKFGTGIFIEPHVLIGARSVISSGAVITGHVSAGSMVKIHVRQRVFDFDPGKDAEL